MSASSEEERDRWMLALREIIEGGPSITLTDVIHDSFIMSVPLTVTYQGVAARDGNELAPRQVMKPPVIAFKATKNRNYTLVMIDPDAPSRHEPIYREFVHWVVVNMPGSNETVASYNGAAPSYNSGLHRYFFFLYEQPSEFSSSHVSKLKEYFVRRGGFTLERWAENMGFGKPIGVEAFQSKWDEYVDELHNEMHFMPPVQYRYIKIFESLKYTNALYCI